MGLVVIITAGLVVWLVMWSLGVKAIDGFMITTVVALIGVTVRMVLPHFPGSRE